MVLDALCIGCHLYTIACPFGTVWTLPKNDKAAKCNLCDGQPACAVSCPTDAIKVTESSQAVDWFADWADRVHSNYTESTYN